MGRFSTYKEYIKNIQIQCPICDWKWIGEEEDDRPYLCHKCSFDSRLGKFDEVALMKWKKKNDK